jgi:hypothetical protein
MQKKCGKFMADWRDSLGKRHRAAFPTAEEAKDHQHRMRDLANPKPRRAPSRGPRRSSSKRKSTTPTRKPRSGSSSKRTGKKADTNSRRRKSKRPAKAGRNSRSTRGQRI